MSKLLQVMFICAIWVNVGLLAGMYHFSKINKPMKLTDAVLVAAIAPITVISIFVLHTEDICVYNCNKERDK